MKRNMVKWIVLACCVGIVTAAGCAADKKVAEEPPQAVLHPENAGNAADNSSSAANIQSAGTGGTWQAPYDGTVRSGAVTAKIGLNDDTEYTIDMYNTAAADTILGYLTESEMRFPTYTYSEAGGYVAQNIRGTYTRDDEQDIGEIHA